MTEKEAFAKRERWLEEKYFRQKEQELIQKIRRRRELKEATGVVDEEILNDLQALGYTRETVEKLLHLVPLVQVAWAEGFVTKRERKRIFEVAGLRGVVEGTPTYRQLTAWLDERPSDEFFEKTLLIIYHLLGLLPPEEREKRKRDLMTYCMLVASASGSILGLWDTVSETEQATLEQIAAELEGKHEAAAKRVIGAE